MPQDERRKRIDGYPHLFSSESILIAVPRTSVDLVAASQILRGAEGYRVDIVDDTIVFSQDEDTFRLTAGQIGPDQTLLNRLPIRWGATVTGKTEAEDRIEIHVLCPPQISNLGLFLTWDHSDDVDVLGVMDDEDGKKQPIAGRPTQLKGQVGSGGAMLIGYYGDSQTLHGFSVADSVEIVNDQPMLRAADDLANLIYGGVDLLVVPGHAQKVYTNFNFKLPHNLPSARDDDSVTQQYDFKKILEQDRGLHYKSIGSRTASISPGQEYSLATTVKFEPEPAKALALKLRLRIRDDMPPLEDTKEYIAWLNTNYPPDKQLQALICISCGTQPLQSVAEIVDSTLTVHKGCSGCGARNFIPVTYHTASG